MNSCKSTATKAALAGVVLAVCGHVQADQPLALIQEYCVDCHGAADESPAADFSLSVDFDSASLPETGPTLKQALDAIEGFEMPPADGDQPTADEREELAAGIRRWLSRPTMGDRHDPGHPVLRRLTRLEYNNTVRDLLGLESDLFMFSERLPFDRSHYQPQSRKMPDRLKMSAREYGAKYSVLLPEASLPGDTRAEHGFANRGDAQNLSAVRLEQYVQLAGEIAFHPELLSLAERMQELFPNATFGQPLRLASGGSGSPRSQTSATGNAIATNDNVQHTAEGSAFDLRQFRQRVETAYAEDRGGVLSGEELRNTRIAGKGGLVRVAYGKTAQRVFAINPNEDWWFAPFATAIESSGETLFANYKKQQRSYELTFQAPGESRFAGIVELGVVVLSRRGEQGVVRLTAMHDDGSVQSLEVTLKPGAGADNTFVSFASQAGRLIQRLAVDGSEFSGDYVLLDDLAFVTRDAPNLEPLVQAEAPYVSEPSPEQPAHLQLNRELGKRPAEERIAHFMRRAFRRDVESSEIDVYAGLYRAEIKRSGNEESAMRFAIQGVLASPSFLYLSVDRCEPADTTNEAALQRPATVFPLADHALASRLSYFLWSSMPDDELFELAELGKLQDDAVLEAQVKRLLADPRSIELSENFFVQWLRLQELWSAQPDRKLFQEFYTGPMGKRTLAQDMFGELLLLFQTILVEDRPVTELLDSPFTFVNGKLAELYDIAVPGPSEPESSTDRAASERPAAALKSFTSGQDLNAEDLDDDRLWHRVHQFDQQRGGIVTSPAVLTLTSFPHRTSSIRRGVWILDTVFNRHPPAPKVAVADIDDQQNAETLTLREKVELHRANAACAVCHDRIDPPGFALENFDAIGRWRTKDGDELIDASGELAGVGKFRDPAEFKTALLSQKRRFAQGLAEHLLSYALGRNLEYFDTLTVEQIVDRTSDEDYRLSRMIIEIAKSQPFRNARRAL